MDGTRSNNSHPILAAMDSVLLVGIRGSGIRSLARLLLNRGVTVTGTDICLSSPVELIREQRAWGERRICICGWDESATLIAGESPLPVFDAPIRNQFAHRRFQAVVVSAAVPKDDERILAARAASIPVLSLSQAVANCFDRHFQICVAGTHGKTTSTAMTWWMLQQQGLAPEKFLGGDLCAKPGRERSVEAKNLPALISDETILASAGESGRSLSHDRIAVIEACEYQRSFLAYSPSIVLLTGVERDHFDCFTDERTGDDAFRQLLVRLCASNDMNTPRTLIVNGDCLRSMSLVRQSRENGILQESVRVVTFGLSSGLDWVARDLRIDRGLTEFTVCGPEGTCVRQHLKTPGVHNIRNALGAIAVQQAAGTGKIRLPDRAAATSGAQDAHYWKADLRPKSATAIASDSAQSTIGGDLATFPGVCRRFEYRGEFRGMTLIDDYAHHPTAVRCTLETARRFFPDRRIIVVFEPHQMSRTEALFEPLRNSLGLADETLILPVLPARENFTPAVCARMSGRIVREVNSGGGRAFLVANLDQAVGRIDHSGRPGDVVITMGAGRTHEIHDELHRRLQRHSAA